MNELDEHIDPELLLRYEEDQLDVAQRSVVEAHVDACGVCRAELALAREYASHPVGATLGNRSDVLKESFRRRLDVHLGPSPAARPVPRVSAPRRRPGLLSLGLLAASAALIALGVYQMQKPSPISDLGRTLRSQNRENRLTLDVERLDDGWQLHARMDEPLEDRRVIVVTADGEMALEELMTGDRFSFTRADLGKFASAEALFVQIVATDAVGNPVRSRPERLP
jgi:hypothetical protein